MTDFCIVSDCFHLCFQPKVFENLVNQTYLPDFISNLAAFCAQYR